MKILLLKPVSDQTVIEKSILVLKTSYLSRTVHFLRASILTELRLKGVKSRKVGHSSLLEKKAKCKPLTKPPSS